MRLTKPLFLASRLGQQPPGMTLVGVMVGVVASTIVLYFASSLFINANNSAKNISLRSDIAEMRDQILENIDCTATIAAMGGVCSIGTPILIKSVIPSRPTLIRVAIPASHVYEKIGIYSLQASCQACGSVPSCTHKLVVQYAAFNASYTAFLTDPLTKQSLDWTYGADLFNGIPIACNVPF